MEGGEGEEGEQGRGGSQTGSETLLNTQLCRQIAEWAFAKWGSKEYEVSFLNSYPSSLSLSCLPHMP